MADTEETKPPPTEPAKDDTAVVPMEPTVADPSTSAAMEKALLADDADAVQNELDGGLELSEYLTRETLEKLYKQALEDATAEQKESMVYTNMVNKFIEDGKYEGHSFLHILGEIMSHDLIEDYEIPNLYDDKKADRPLELHDLFIWAAITGRTKLTKLFWNIDSDQIVSGLIACMMFTFTAKHLPDDIYHADLREDLFKLSMEYQQLSLFVIKECYRLDKKGTSDILVKQRRKWGDIAPLDAVDMAEDMEIMSHAACQFTLDNIWMGRMTSSTPKWKILAAMIFPPLLFIIEYVEDEDPTHEHEDGLTVLDRITFYYTAPITKFMYSVVSHVLLIFIFSYMVLFELQPLSKEPIGWSEGLMVLWIAILGLEEIRQMVGAGVMIQTWISNPWNILDIFIVALFEISFLIRLSLEKGFEKTDFQLIRILYCFTLILICYRTFPMFYLSKTMGPKIVMIWKMVGDVMFFLCILAVFVVAYGVPRLALTEPDSKFTPAYTEKVFRTPYWQMHGELLYLEEGEGPDLPWYVDFMEAGYMLLVNVMLLNLLIALFTFTIEHVQEHAHQYWSYYRYDVIQEYHDRPLGPGPLLLVGLVWKLWQHYGAENGEMSNNPFRRAFSGKEDTNLQELEKKAVANVQTKLEKGIYKIQQPAEDSPPEDVGGELKSLSERMTSMEGDLKAIRTLLEDLNKI
ncbi:transient receptor potential cation channel subfamily M member-like 2 [Branchiostoma floridae x Branchiostoma japonicum]